MMMMKEGVEAHEVKKIGYRKIEKKEVQKRDTKLYKRA